MLKVILLIFIATVVEATGDAILRKAIANGALSARILLFLAGAILLTAYGTLLNLAPVDFGTATGVYIACLFVCFQIANYVFFGTTPHTTTFIGGALIVSGGIVIYIGR